MEKEKSKKLVQKYFKFKRKVQNIFNTQIDEFYQLKDEYKSKGENYDIGNDVILNDKTLIHGTRLSLSDLKEISSNGLIAPEFLGRYNKNKKKPFVVEFWEINEQMSLKEFIDKYCGVTIEVKDNMGKIISKIFSPINKIEQEILKLKNYRDYIIYQNQEQRFLPNKYNTDTTFAFMIKENKEIEKYLKNDIFDIDFDKKILKQLVPKWFYKKYMLTRNFDNYETGREKAILYGIPSNFIEGIVINNNLITESNLKMVKELFPNCYICNIDGKVIVQ